MQMPVEVPVEQSISSTSEEEELKSNDTTSVVALGTGTPNMSIYGYELSHIRTAESTCVTTFQNCNPSSRFRARHWIDAVDTLL